MINYREILRLDSLGYSQRSIASGAQASRNTVSEVLKKAEQLNISWPLDDDATNEMLDELFYGKRDSHPTPYAVIDYEYIHRELSKKGVTITLLWNEYCERAYANGEKPYMCHIHAYEYFGGVTRVLVPDNLKTGVTSNTRYETQLNESYRELAEYYGTAIVPARVRKPQDKGLVERSVGFSTTWITAALRERKFFSFAEVREAVDERLEYVNTKPFQKRSGNRREAYLSEEKEFMLPLPKRRYEPSVWKQQTVGNDYLISDGLNKYSVPFDLIGEQVQIRLTKDLVEVYFKGSRMTSHKRLEKYSIQPIVKPEHMPANHREYLNYNADEFKEWASSVGTSTEEVVRYFLNSGSVPEQGYKSCVSLTKLGKRYGKKKLEAACERMLAFSSSPSIRTITTLLKNSKEPEKSVETTDESNKYGITRGAAYWKKGGAGK